MRDLNLALTITARDRATTAVSAAMQAVTRNSQAAGRAMAGAGREHARLAAAREVLGVRGEQAVQREVAQTQAAYNRLARSGTLSAQEQARAYQAMTRRVAELRGELGQAARLGERLGRGWGNARALGAGVLAGGYVMNRALGPVEDYDLRLRHMANTAYADQDLAGRRAGMGELDAAIRRAVANGGNRDAAADTLDQMIASGALGEGETGRRAAMDLLPTLTRYATAGNASPQELADIALKAKKTLGIADTDFPRALEMAFLGGKLGGFEMKDMSRWLPQQMAAASTAGLRGLPGLAKLVALNQNAVVAAGSKDEAGNNVVNFLAKLNAEETSKDFAKVGINWRQKLVDGAKGGQDAVDVFGDAIDGLLRKNAAYQKLQAKLATATGDEKKAVLEQMARVVQGSVVGKISQDRQELMAVIALLNDRAGMAEIERQLNEVKPGQVVDTDLQLVQESAAWKGEQAANKLAERQFDALGGLASAVGDVKMKLVEYADKYPGLSTALVGATTALTALAAAATAASAMQFLTPGRPGQGGGAPGTAPGGAAPGGAVATGKAGLWAGLMRTLGLATLLNSAATFSTSEEDDEVLHGEERWAKLRQQYPSYVIDQARQLYQPWYQFGDGYAAENEEWVRRYVEAGGGRNVPNQAAPIPQSGPTGPVPAPWAVGPVVSRPTAPGGVDLDRILRQMQDVERRPVPLQITVDVQGGNIVAAVNEANARDGRRG
ncbi:phage tail tape measure protein [Chitiniphilus eburneus]|uniref:phage tail tape measure protein n=1 Tax=Chitiniphilus eburneus TaxID=2571148 RepID=UPI0035D04E55